MPPICGSVQGAHLPALANVECANVTEVSAFRIAALVRPDLDDGTGSAGVVVELVRRSNEMSTTLGESMPGPRP
jgi:hypothetical protein